MPAPQLHLTFGELVADHDGIVPAMRRAARQEPVYTRLGSIFHDLPYYGNMIAEAIRYGLGRPAIDSPWSYRMHCMRPDRFVASYIRAAATTPGFNSDERRALVAGLMSHCALDLTLHPLVNYCARRDTALLGGHESFHHRITEKYQALFFHIERFGDDVIGKREFRDKTMVVKQGSRTRPRAEPQIVALMREAYRHAYGNAPRGQLWVTWVRNFSHFGVSVANGFAAANSRKVRQNESLYRRYYKCDDFDFNAFYLHSERRVAELVNLAHAYFLAGDFSPAAEDRFCADAHIDNLADPDGIGLPSLPALPTPAKHRRIPFLPRRKRVAVERAA